MIVARTIHEYLLRRHPIISQAGWMLISVLQDRGFGERLGDFFQR